MSNRQTNDITTPSSRLVDAWGNQVSMRFGKPFDIRSLNRNSEWRQSIARDQKQLVVDFVLMSDRCVACPICSSQAALPLMKVHSVDYLQCTTCSHVYSELSPSASAVQSLYQEAGLGVVRSSQAKIYLDEKLFAQRKQLIGRPKVDFVTQVIGTPMDHEWLDIGCGTGEVLAAARDAGWLVRGIEADTSFVEFARLLELEIDQAFVNGDNSRELMRDANIISLFNVVEHISDPLALLKAISLGARPNAWIVIEVPRHPSISSLSNAFFPAMSARHICPPDHLHIFTDKSLRLLLEQAKIDAKALWFFGQDYQDLVMTGVAGSDVFNQAFLDQVLDCAPAIQQSIDQAGLSDTVLVVGRFSSAS